MLNHNGLLKRVRIVKGLIEGGPALEQTVQVHFRRQPASAEELLQSQSQVFLGPIGAKREPGSSINTISPGSKG
jgi:hypothetical protein